VNVQARSHTFARPYLGIGAGTVRLGDVGAPAFHLNAGIALGRRDGVSLMAEMRSQRILGDIDAAAGRLSVGLGLGF